MHELKALGKGGKEGRRNEVVKSKPTVCEMLSLNMTGERGWMEPL